MTSSLDVVARMPVHGVWMSQPANEISYPVLGFGPDHKMPVIRQHDVGKDRLWYLGMSLTQHSFEGFIIFGFPKQSERGARND